ncbi:tRNA(Ile)(2)-agmatinylcytidine synthase [Halosegnis marinus]|uniref:tRNA(Ile2) 2-agmatinylcytidine synthetase TiaS n=1 Tax=Halosegnis marinus TaxID=3034023 RepID=A0ABD5ZNF9_9EURY|nr:tRNA(Ile)(2)-agmatinylcytidine synthase [Halosegnis sp. DT85]
MTVVGLDDTDSREGGMCTTYAAALVAERLGASARYLVRLNPAVPYKTRGNAALAVVTEVAPDEALAAAREVVGREAVTGDERTNPGVVVAPGTPEDAPDAVADWTDRAMRDLLAPDDARALCDEHGYRTAAWDTGQGLVGALAAVGAARAWERAGLAPTYETITYRERDRWGTEREVDYDSLFDAADEWYPTVWDTVDRATGEPVAVPHTPGPVLHGIRGDDPDATRACARAVDSESVERRVTFRTNQGTDAHLADGTPDEVRDGRGYRLDATVVRAPETRQGGHVFLAVGDDGVDLPCAAFAPTGRFRDRVRALRVGDDLTVCGEVAAGTLKLEKFAVRDLVGTERVTPECPDCGRRMESAGRGQGYRCRGDCGTTAPGKVERDLERDLERGWYEVPPSARRHVAKPLVRGGFDAPVHPER